MIISSNSKQFNPAWLELIEHDPVHPTIDKNMRATGTRAVLMYDEQEQHQCIICTKVSDDLVRSMKDIFADSMQQGATAMFYTIFRLPDALMGVGQRALMEAVAHFKERGVKNFYTLSPVPSLRKQFDTVPTEQEIRDYIATAKDPVARFHLGNGAVLHSVNFDADSSDIRHGESWGIMVNYCYQA